LLFDWYREKSMIKQRIKNSPLYRIIRPVMFQSRQLKRWIRPPKGVKYDAQMFKVMSWALRPDAVCIDVGASSGDILKRIVQATPEGRHYAIEALPHLAERLTEQFPSVRVFDCAVSDYTGEAPFHFVTNRSTFSGLRRRTYNFGYPAEVEEIRVKTRRLDDLIHEDVQVDFIKMDIEGGEYHAMLGGAKTIRRCRPIIVFEAGEGAIKHYGISLEMIHDLIVRDFGMELSTMKRWMSGKPSFSKEEFLAACRKDFYFIAYPKNGTE
jgi:FkbM family methyltransferase